MPARTLPRVPKPQLGYRCVWEGCDRPAEACWRRNKWRFRLYCRTHRAYTAELNRRLGLSDGPKGKRDGRRLARVAGGKFVPYQIARYRQLAGDDKLANRKVYAKNKRVDDVSLRNLGIMSNRRWRYRMVMGKEQAA